MNSETATGDDRSQLARSAIQATASWVSSMQRKDGSWKGEFVGGPYVDALDVLFREFLGWNSPSTMQQVARGLLLSQCADGGWASYHGGESTTTNTVACYVALQIAGVADHDPQLQRAKDFVRAHGGMETIKPWLAVHLAFVGLWDWDALLPVPPPEYLLLPDWLPLSSKKLAWWANAMLTPLSICYATRPTRPCGVDVSSLWVKGPVDPTFRTALSKSTRALLRTGDWLNRAKGPLYARAAERVRTLILQSQDSTGLFSGGIIFSTHFNLAAAVGLGIPSDDPVFQN